MKNPSISVIIPAYNTEKYIARCIESVLSQTYKDFEIIVLNDGSTDSTYDISKSYAGRHDAVRAYSYNNFGVSRMRNEGLTYARGKYICFVDSDDELYENALEIMYKAMQNHDAVFAGHTDIFKSSSKSYYGDHAVYSLSELKKNGFVLYKKNILNPVWGKLFRNDIIQKNGIKFDENISLGEDLKFVLQYTDKCDSFVSIPAVVYKYYKYTGNLAATHSTEVINLMFMQQKMVYRFFEEKVRSQVDDFFVRKIRRYIGSNRNGKKNYEDVKNDINEIAGRCELEDVKCKKLHSKIILFLIKHRMTLVYYMLVKMYAVCKWLLRKSA